VRHGYDGMLRASAHWLEAWDEQTFEAVRLWDAEDLVFLGARESGRGKISGIPMEHESTFVFTLSGGRLSASRSSAPNAKPSTPWAWRSGRGFRVPDRESRVRPRA
jgi:hypothetical protein